jgi:indole-3-glycerol phosphate synthase
MVRVIAEIKRRSPSKGVINEAIVAGARAAAYGEGGAAALSVLTEPSRFGGSLEDLAQVRAAVGLPLLRKDFITDEVQLLEARVHGASAVLLIARALEPGRLAGLARAARATGLECLVEVRDERELERAIAVDAAAIGVNNRDLETLVIDPAVGARLVGRVPVDRIAVYESGIQGVADVERAAAAGADAVLVGSVLSAAADGAAAVRALAAVRRVARG